MLLIKIHDTLPTINIIGREDVGIVCFRVIGDVLKIQTSIDNSILTVLLHMMVVLGGSCNNIIDISIERYFIDYYYITVNSRVYFSSNQSPFIRFFS